MDFSDDKHGLCVLMWRMIISTEGTSGLDLCGAENWDTTTGQRSLLFMARLTTDSVANLDVDSDP